MPKPLTLLALVIALPLAASCSSGGPNTPHVTPATALATTVARSAGPKPAKLVLHLSDLGYGYLVDPESGAVSLRQELNTDLLATSKAADRAGYLGGHRMYFVDGAKDVVMDVALLYRPGPYMAEVTADLTPIHRLLRAWGALPVALPAAAPGTHRRMFYGLDNEDGVAVPAYLYMWRHGTVLNELFLFGRHVSVARVVTLAVKQNDRQTRLGL